MAKGKENTDGGHGDQADQDQAVALEAANAEIKELNAENEEQCRNIELLGADLIAAQKRIEALEAENAELKKPAGNPLNIKGFVLEHDDPFGAGTLRVYLANTRKKQAQRPGLPFVLPDNDPASKLALQSYIIRAAGGGDNERAEAARAVEKKIKAK